MIYLPVIRTHVPFLIIHNITINCKVLVKICYTQEPEKGHGQTQE